LIDILAEAVDTPESVRAIRTFLLLTKFFGSIRPEVLSSLVQAATERSQSERSRTRPQDFSSFSAGCVMRTAGMLLALTLDLVESVGKGL
jgi:hypothetical protein